VARYVVTGGCGFIGSHLADRLVNAGHSVTIVDDLSTGKLSNRPSAASLVKGDIGDTELLRGLMREADGCFHLAAIASVERARLDVLMVHRTNLTGTINVFDAARKASVEPIPVVYASSAAVYGDNPDIPLAETARPRPLSGYGADKLGCEQHAFVAGLIHRIPTVGLRFFNVYGPRQDPSSPYSGVISIFAEKLRNFRPLTIHGDGEQFRDFVYVSDVVVALEAAMRHASTAAPVYNVCTGRATTIRNLADSMAAAMGVGSSICFEPPRTGDIRGSLGDPRKAREMIAFAAATSLYEGLRQLLADYTAVK
jgi:UDP-glucose 4-epimerase